MILYFEVDNLIHLFEVIYSHYTRVEEVPRYEDYAEGISKIGAILQGVKSDHYQTLYEKAAYLFIQINKGHFFPNGNKRLAVVVSIGFLFLNDCDFIYRSKSDYKRKIEAIFPQFNDFKEFPEFSPEDTVFYNLSILVADNHRYEPDFDKLKKGAESLFGYAFSLSL